MYLLNDVYLYQQKQRDMKTKRINTGIYRIVKANRTFEAEKTEDGQWQLIELVECVYSNQQITEYVDHYLDLKSCKVFVEYYA